MAVERPSFAPQLPVHIQHPQGREDEADPLEMDFGV